MRASPRKTAGRPPPRATAARKPAATDGHEGCGTREGEGDREQGRRSSEAPREDGEGAGPQGRDDPRRGEARSRQEVGPDRLGVTRGR